MGMVHSQEPEVRSDVNTSFLCATLLFVFTTSLVCLHNMSYTERAVPTSSRIYLGKDSGGQAFLLRLQPKLLLVPNSKPGR